MKTALFIIVIIFLTGCMQSSPDIGDFSGPDSRLVNEISRKVCLQLKKEKNLYPIGFGGNMVNKIKMLHLAFKYYRQIELEEARELLLSAENVFLNSINEDERIRDYLVNYPFKSENIMIDIYINNIDGSEVIDGKLCLISMSNGIIDYGINDLKNNKWLTTTIHSESCAEAKKKLTEVNF